MVSFPFVYLVPLSPAVTPACLHFLILFFLLPCTWFLFYLVPWCFSAYPSSRLRGSSPWYCPSIVPLGSDLSVEWLTVTFIWRRALSKSVITIWPTFPQYGPSPYPSTPLPILQPLPPPPHPTSSPFSLIWLRAPISFYFELFPSYYKAITRVCSRMGWFWT